MSRGQVSMVQLQALPLVRIILKSLNTVMFIAVCLNMLEMNKWKPKDATISLWGGCIPHSALKVAHMSGIKGLVSIEYKCS